MPSISNPKLFTLIFTTLTLFSPIVTLFLLYTTSLATYNLTLYPLLSLILSLLGIHGALTSHPAYLLIFSRLQLIDTILTTIPTLVVLALAAGWHQSVCSLEWEGMAHGTFLEEEGIAMKGDGCKEVVWGVAGVAGVVMMGLAALRVLAVGVVRKWAQELEMAGKMGEEAVMEKGEITVEWRDEKLESSPSPSSAAEKQLPLGSA